MLEQTCSFPPEQKNSSQEQILRRVDNLTRGTTQIAANRCRFRPQQALSLNAGIREISTGRKLSDLRLGSDRYLKLTLPARTFRRFSASVLFDRLRQCLFRGSNCSRFTTQTLFCQEEKIQKWIFMLTVLISAPTGQAFGTCPHAFCI